MMPHRFPAGCRRGAEREARIIFLMTNGPGQEPELNEGKETGKETKGVDAERTERIDRLQRLVDEANRKERQFSKQVKELADDSSRREGKSTTVIQSPQKESPEGRAPERTLEQQKMEDAVRGRLLKADPAFAEQMATWIRNLNNPTAEKRAVDMVMVMPPDRMKAFMTATMAMAERSVQPGAETIRQNPLNVVVTDARAMYIEQQPNLTPGQRQILLDGNVVLQRANAIIKYEKNPNAPMRDDVKRQLDADSKIIEASIDQSATAGATKRESEKLKQQEQNKPAPGKEQKTTVIPRAAPENQSNPRAEQREKEPPRSNVSAERERRQLDARDQRLLDGIDKDSHEAFVLQKSLRKLSPSDQERAIAAMEYHKIGPEDKMRIVHVAEAMADAKVLMRQGGRTVESNIARALADNPLGVLMGDRNVELDALLRKSNAENKVTSVDKAFIEDIAAKLKGGASVSGDANQRRLEAEDTMTEGQRISRDFDRAAAEWRRGSKLAAVGMILSSASEWVIGWTKGSLGKTQAELGRAKSEKYKAKPSPDTQANTPSNPGKTPDASDTTLSPKERAEQEKFAKEMKENAERIAREQVAAHDGGKKSVTEAYDNALSSMDNRIGGTKRQIARLKYQMSMDLTSEENSLLTATEKKAERPNFVERQVMKVSGTWSGMEKTLQQEQSSLESFEGARTQLAANETRIKSLPEPTSADIQNPQQYTEKLKKAVQENIGMVRDIRQSAKDPNFAEANAQLEKAVSNLDKAETALKVADTAMRVAVTAVPYGNEVYSAAFAVGQVAGGVDARVAAQNMAIDIAMGRVAKGVGKYVGKAGDTTVRQAIKEGAIVGGTISGGRSTYENAKDVWNGDKTIGQAAQDVVKDTAKGVVVGGATGGATRVAGKVYDKYRGGGRSEAQPNQPKQGTQKAPPEEAAPNAQSAPGKPSSGPTDKTDYANASTDRLRQMENNIKGNLRNARASSQEDRITELENQLKRTQDELARRAAGPGWSEKGPKPPQAPNAKANPNTQQSGPDEFNFSNASTGRLRAMEKNAPDAIRNARAEGNVGYADKLEQQLREVQKELERRAAGPGWSEAGPKPPPAPNAKANPNNPNDASPGGRQGSGKNPNEQQSGDRTAKPKKKQLTQEEAQQRVNEQRQRMQNREMAKANANKDTNYRQLGVSPNASQEETANAYRALAKQFHPDRNPGDAEAARRFNEAKTAYEQLALANGWKVG